MSFERIEPDTPEWQAYFANHLQRYMFAEHHLKGLQAHCVLDAACGVGYGSRHLASTGSCTVTGVDRDTGALKIATSRFSHYSVKFLQDDCNRLETCGQAGEYDAIVSFETLEHLSQPQRFLMRCVELLGPAGALIVSTPNASRNLNRRFSWKYHEKEYTATEFVSLLRACGFKEVSLFGQQYTGLGKLRNSVRQELNGVRSNPFVRIGGFVQRITRRSSLPSVVLAEQIEDFEIQPVSSPQMCEDWGCAGPFALICIAKKSETGVGTA